ncbi:phage major capsid protein [Azospirillum tabaci]|uniref:phage major capsid protein n=1 Tax=Azospirillum tabaci TaxID=2752310 RepID=UPI001661003C|nr:phage major capsid protein [Azospirillum tabaci]
MNKNSLLAKRGELLDEAEKLIDGATKALEGDQLKRFDAIKAEVGQIDAQIKQIDDMDALKSSSATLVSPGIGAPGILRGAEDVQPEKGHVFAAVVRSFACAKGNMDAALKIAKDAEDVHLQKALMASEPVAGGLLVTPEVADDFIDLNRPMEVVSPMVDDVRPLDAGALSIRRGTSDAIAAFKGEGQPAAVSTPGTGSVSLVARELSAIVPISNRLLQFTQRNSRANRADQMALNSLLRATALRKDLAYIRGDGSNNTPRGLRSFAEEAGNLVAAAGSVSVVNIDNDQSKLLTRLANANIQMLKPGWIMAPRTRIYLGSLRDGNGNRVYPECYQKQADGRHYWGGYPILETTQVPINLGGGGNESEIGLIDFAEVVHGDIEGVMVGMSTEATYWDGQAWQSAFQNSETLIKVDMAVDQQMKHIEASAWLTGVTWGAGAS